MAHLAGLVAAGVIPSPVPHSDFVTFTCYKTLKGGRGGMILCREKFGKKIDSTIFPGCQGTSAVNMIAAKALIFKLAAEPEFIQGQRQTLANAVHLAAELENRGFRIVTGGTENHQVLVDLSSEGLSGDTAEKGLEIAGIIANRNVIPSDAATPGKVSGLRLGTSAVTTRGMGKEEMSRIADLITTALRGPQDRDRLELLAQEVKRLCSGFPVYA
jgi:glycine hydroxymethyltransferase